MTTRRLSRAAALVALLCAPAPAVAQTARTTQTAQTAAAAPYAAAWLDAVAGSGAERLQAGDSAVLSARLVNASDAELQIRRVIVTAANFVRFADPTSDRLDNDSNDAIDDGREALAAVTSENALVWTLSGADAVGHPPVLLAPGESVMWRVLTVLDDTVELGADAEMAVAFLASTRGADGRLRVLRTTARAEARAAPVRAAWRAFGPAVARAQDGPLFTHDDPARWRLTVELPPGLTPALSLNVTPPPSAQAFTLTAANIGEGLTCSAAAPPEPAADHRGVIWRLGDCLGAPDLEPSPEISPETDSDSDAESPEQTPRALILEATARIVDVDPFAEAFDSFVYRYDRLGAAISYGAGAGVTENVWTLVPIAGPVLRIALEDARPAETFRAGDFIRRRFRITNVGDRPARDLQLWLEARPALDCRRARLDLIDRAGSVSPGETDAVCGQIIGLGAASPLEQDDSLLIEAAAPVRQDAPLDAPLTIALGAAATDFGGLRARTASQIATFTPEPPGASDSGPEPTSWGGDPTTPVALPGGEGALRLTIAAPPGETTLEAALYTRLINAATGVPAGPAPLATATAALAEIESTASHIPPVNPTPRIEAPEDGWSALRLPLGAIRSTAAGLERQVTVGLTLRLAFPENANLGQGQAIQIRTDLHAAGAIIPAEPIFEAAVRQPALKLAVVTTDEDYLLAAGDRTGFVADACNLGDAPAYAVVLSALLPPELLGAAPTDATIGVRGQADLTPPRTTPVAFDAAAQTMTARLSEPLPPETCAQLRFVAQAADPLAPDSIAEAVFTLDAYANRPDGPRLHSGGDPAVVRLRAPGLRFGPSARSTVAAGGEIVYDAAVVTPPDGGPFALSLRFDSTAGLEWAFFRIDPDTGAETPWADAARVDSGETLLLRARAVAPRPLPLDWVDTTAARINAEARSPEMNREAALRWITAAADALAAQIDTHKVMAVDRNCDGALADEAAQDATFEPYKEARAGECVVFRVVFANTGDASMEEITLRDAPPTGTVFRPGALMVSQEPEGYQDVEMRVLRDGDLYWRFIGDYAPGAQGAVEYHVAIAYP